MNGSELTAGKWYKFYPYSYAPKAVWYMKCVEASLGTDNCKGGTYIGSYSDTSTPFHKGGGGGFAHTYPNGGYIEVIDLTEVNQYLPSELQEKDITLTNYSIC